MKKKTYLVMSATIIAALLIGASYANQHEYASAASTTATTTPTSPDFSFGAAGDWSISNDAKDTADSMANHQVQLALGLGDYAYAIGSNAVNSWWEDQMAALHGTTFEGALGNHDVSDSATYVKKFGSANTGTWYYSFNKQNVHFLALNPNEPYKVGSAQYLFAKNDLALAESNTTNIKWIVVFFHQPIYTSPSGHDALSAMRDIYHPLFDKYGVDLVLQGHVHNYQRSYPIKYNSADPSNPIITDISSNNTYNDPKGEIYAIVGTGGQHHHSLQGKAPYMVSQFDDTCGYLNIAIENSGLTMKAKFYSDDGIIKDSFTINKSQENNSL